MSSVAPDTVPDVLLVAFAVAALTALTSLIARRLRIPQPFLLVIVGACVAFVPGVPVHEMDPDLVLLLLLPPLLYAAGVSMSWRGFRDNLRPILMLAIGCVLFTASAVAAACHYLLGIPWAVGLVLGAVVSPPDAVAPMAIAKRLSVPKRLLTILEGEGLVNDATALILFSFAVHAVVSGSMSSIPQAGLSFLAIAGAEIAWGLVLASTLLYLRCRADDAEVEMILALLTPFIAFWPPHFLGGSGVLAAVTAGLYTSRHGPRLISSKTRLQGFFVWGLAIYLIDGVVFFLTGLQARLVADSYATGRWQHMIAAAVITTVVVIVIRFVWVFPASYVPRPRRLREMEAAPTWQGTFLVAFTGIRGAMSLVAALSIPNLAGAVPFPDRDLILFVTFCVILFSLIGQGALLPKVIQWLGLDHAGNNEATLARNHELAARLAAIDSALGRLSALETHGVDPATADQLRRAHEDRRLHFLATAGQTNNSPDVETRTAVAASVQLQMLAAERQTITNRHAQGRLNDDARQRIERELDLEEARLLHAAESAGGPGTRAAIQLI